MTGLPDAVDFLLDGQFVETGKGKTEKKRNSPFENQEGIEKGPRDTQAYWGESTYTVKKRLGLNLRLTYNSSRSGMRPDVNPADANKLGNASIIPFDPMGLFPSALGNVQFGATQVSEVIVPQWIGQGKGYYLFPRKFERGLVFYYGSYRDYFNPNLNGVLRTISLYVGRSW